MIRGHMLENSFQNFAGSQIAFHGAFTPGGFKYAEMTVSKPIV